MSSPNDPGAVAQRLPQATVWLDLPDGAERGALRAGLMAMGLPPQAMPREPSERARVWAGVVADARSLAFVDITVNPQAPVPHLLALQQALPTAAPRARVFLTRLGGGHVHASERQWLQRLGYADLLSEFDPRARKGALEALLDRVAALLARPRVDRAELARYLRVMEAPAKADAPRALIRRHTGLGAEELVARLEPTLDVQDRRWRLKEYEQCFVGRETVDLLAREYGLDRTSAVAVGRALGALGLVAHVVHEHEFEDADYFYRLNWSGVLDGMDLGAMHATLTKPERVPVQNRSWHGRSYPMCWVGEDAVNALCGAHRLSRQQAVLALQRLMSLGLFEHVTRERPVIDGEFFYRHLAPR